MGARAALGYLHAVQARGYCAEKSVSGGSILETARGLIWRRGGGIAAIAAAGLGEKAWRS